MSRPDIRIAAILAISLALGVLRALGLGGVAFILVAVAALGVGQTLVDIRHDGATPRRAFTVNLAFTALAAALCVAIAGMP